jgi:hypothetical protein
MLSRAISYQKLCLSRSKIALKDRLGIKALVEPKASPVFAKPIQCNLQAQLKTLYQFAVGSVRREIITPYSLLTKALIPTAHLKVTV